MPTFGPSVAGAAWPVLQAIGALTSVRVSTVTGTTTDYETGAVVETLVEQTLEAKVSPFKPNEIDGLRILVADKKVLLLQAEVTTPPTVRSTVTMSGLTWALQAPPELVSNEGLWQLHIRRIGDV
jgi:hypothetical protein